jgi:hypothetical protein
VSSLVVKNWGDLHGKKSKSYFSSATAAFINNGVTTFIAISSYSSLIYASASPTGGNRTLIRSKIHLKGGDNNE